MHLRDLHEPKSDRSLIFTSVDSALNFLQTNGYIGGEKTCYVCSFKMNMQRNKQAHNQTIFRCLNRKCRKQIPLFYGSQLSSPKIAIHDYLYLIYKWLENGFEADTLRNSKISKRSYQEVKKKLINWCSTKIRTDGLLGTNGKRVQVDETAVSHGKLPKSPSNLPDDFPGVSWLLGIIEEETNEIRLICLVDRKAETFSEIFKENISFGATIITDGHRSYPLAVDAVNGTHIVVNHSKGFKNEEGFHTNNIENVWSIFKYEISKRRGIKRTNFDEFLIEWMFRYKYLRVKHEEIMHTLFHEIVEFLIKY